MHVESWTVVCGILLELPYKDLKNISFLLFGSILLPRYGDDGL
jgi:hypothetical protein